MLKKITNSGCTCLHVLTPRKALYYIWEEVVELAEEPSMEELSDVAFAFGRFLGALTGRLYIRVPLDRRSLRKMAKRAYETGCIRSLRHRPMGTCFEKENT